MQFQRHAPGDPQERRMLADRVHQFKNEVYAGIVAGGGVDLRAGVRELLQDCERAGVRLGIVTTTSHSNVDVLLRTQLGNGWQSTFAVVVSAREAPRKKPHPQAYLLALDSLQLRPQEAVAMEDAEAGAAAAEAAGVPAIVARSYFFGAADFPGALAAGPSLGRAAGWHPVADACETRIDLRQIIQWHARSRWAR
jgi:HAD superfamily hydrolase (TIGR01509 family)